MGEEMENFNPEDPLYGKETVDKDEKKNVASYRGYTEVTSGSSSSKPEDVSAKVKAIVKKFIKSLTRPDLKIDGNKHFEKQNVKIFDFGALKKMMKLNSNESTHTCIKFSKNEQFKEYTSWESMTKEIDKNINENFDIRGRYDAVRPLDVHPPKQNYYFVDGYGLVSEKFLPDFQRLKVMGLADYGGVKGIHTISKSKNIDNLKLNYY